MDFLEFNRDQPTGAYRLGMFEFQPTRIAEREARVRDGRPMGPVEPALRSALAIAYSLEGRPADAAKQLREACRLAPSEAQLRFQLGLA